MNKKVFGLISGLLALWMCFSLIGSVVTPVLADSEFAGGSGTEEDPYLVATADQLNNVRNHLSKHFKQITDIDLNVAPYNTGTGWQPIGPAWPDVFNGTYDGNGHIIMNLSIEGWNELDGTGLFGHLLGEIKNLGLEGVNINGKTYNGTIAAVLYTSAKVNRCYAVGEINGKFYTGGLVGRNVGTISDSYAHVSVFSDRAGGLVGDNDGIVIHSYSTGSVTGEPWVDYLGGLVGYSAGGDGTVLESYWDMETSGLETSVGGIGKSNEQMKQQNTYSTWDFDNIWGIDEGVSYPYLLVFLPEPSSPVITSVDNTTFTVGEAGTFTVMATGDPVPTLSQTSALPGGVTFTDNDNGTASLAGTPAAGSGGVYNLTITASNGVEPYAVQAFTLTVKTVKNIGGGGGTIESNDGALEINVPAGAVPDGTEFTLVPQSEPSQGTGDLSFAGMSFVLTATDALGNPITSFDPPLVVTIQYDPAALGDIPEETLMLYFWDGITWEDAACGPYDRNTPNQFMVEICHLSEFAVLGNGGGYHIYLPLITQ